ncbi:GNAT family N-acetyltransferase [Sulfitobacter guttiformis]|uniref:RimJ/RimL family protein N-acetyltransferase n=1 Tax=Sulfitobacter guttiformis TaxID=74349 RepID=A0A420DKB5_9RHOB|nr:GNAT family N-acetyltransferase [Sulfitobacter guttiformis]KIN71526.1 Butyryltransferase [Sulfitobacter guttiformis KCTC 32187]RKE94635.1 RimJ/RimL family protein N-acetyltransferase [Sulfitobacter guttiformis]
MPQPNLAHIDGVSLSLRLAQPQDAAYIHALRMDPTYNRHLSAVTGTVEDQANWIRRYKVREAEGSEYYYVIERRLDAQACGLVRLYDITGNQFTWGSWILDHNKPPKAALESAVLIYQIGFQRLGKNLSVFDVRGDNARTLAFHARFGAVETGKDNKDVFFHYRAEQFAADFEGHMAALKSTSLE